MKCSLDVDAEEKKFSLRPMAGEMEATLRTGESKMGSALASALGSAGVTIPVYYGKP